MAYACYVLPRFSRARSVLAFAPAVLLISVGCGRGPEQSKDKTGTPLAAAAGSAPPITASTVPPSFLRYPGQSGAIEPWVQEQVELADAAHVRVLVYVGATWCEPCQRFHEAVQRGELNGTLNGLRFLEFDQDHDAPALKAAGYSYQYIPVLALPDTDGHNHGHMISGSIKGPDAVKTNLVPRLQALLSGKVVD